MDGFKRLRGEPTAARLVLSGRGYSLVHVLIIGAVSICAAVGALFGLNMLYERDTAVDVARRATSNLAESLARQASDAFAATDCALFGLAERVRTEPNTPAGRERLQKWMAMQVFMVPRMHELRVVDERGRLQASNRTFALGRKTNEREVAYFRDHADAGVQIGLNQAKDGWQILVSRRVDRDDGGFGGAVIAVIPSAYFEQIYASVDVGRLGVIALLADDGTVLVDKRMPLIGRRGRDVEIPVGASTAGSSETSLVSRSDRARRLFALRRLDQYPLTIVVGVAESEYLAGWRGAAVLNIVAVSLVTVMIALLAAGLRLQIRRRKLAEDTLARLALLDGLTGLANRRQFDAVLEREWNRAQRDGTPLALLMIDVDNFKAFNDRYGHLEGDKVLVAIAHALAACVVRGGDLAARYGGEEFAVILPATNTAGAHALGERIREAIVALGIPHSGTTDAVATVSVGVAAVSPRPSSALSALVRTADNALYDAKRSGRNRTSVMPEGVETARS